MNQQTSVEQLDILVSAAYPVLFVVSYEEDRVEAALEQIVARHNKAGLGTTDLWTWSVTTGATCLNKKVRKEAADGPIEILEFIEKYPSSGIFVLRDFGFFLAEGSFEIQRRLRDLTSKFTRAGLGSSIVIVDSVLDLPPRLEKTVTVVDFDYPDRNELADRLRATLLQNPTIASIPSEELEALLQRGVECATGLTLLEAENVFAKSIAMTETIDPTIIIQDKKSIIRKSGVLEYYDVRTDMGDVGGLENLKEWLSRRGRAFSREARQYGLPVPKGVLIAGVPGTGKSLIAKAIGQHWNMPVLRMDIGALFGQYVGQSEANMRKALKTAEAMAPSILWIKRVHDKSCELLELAKSLIPTAWPETASATGQEA